MTTLNETSENPKQRHGCVTTWLILVIILNSLIALLYLFAGDIIAQNFPGGISNSMLILLAVLGIANVVFSVMLLNWKKIGFWGVILSSIVALVVNLSIGIGIAQSIVGLIGVVVLYGVLQIKKDNISAWENLD